MAKFTPTPYHHTQVFRFRHVRPCHVFRVTEAWATPEVPAGFYLRVSPRKAIPCTYDEWAPGPHIPANAGVRYLPANLPVLEVQV